MLFVKYRDQTRTVSFAHPNNDCNTCGDDTGLRMRCGHYLCPDDLLDQAWREVETMKYEVSCTACDKIIPYEDIIKFGLPTLEEEQFLTTAITTNFYESQDINECPKCHTLCSRQRSDSPQVHCSICPKSGANYFMFCWYCLRDWKNLVDQQVCGNANCMRETIQTLLNCPKKDFTDFNGKSISIPIWRACPYEDCNTLIEHTIACNMMTCKCRRKFCFICLRKTNNDSFDCKSRSYNNTGIRCSSAPIQTKLRK